MKSVSYSEGQEGRLLSDLRGRPVMKSVSCFEGQEEESFG